MAAIIAASGEKNGPKHKGCNLGAQPDQQRVGEGGGRGEGGGGGGGAASRGGEGRGGELVNGFLTSNIYLCSV